MTPYGVEQGGLSVQHNQVHYSKMPRVTARNELQILLVEVMMLAHIKP